MKNNPEKELKPREITRREFLREGLVVLGGLAVESYWQKMPFGTARTVMSRGESFSKEGEILTTKVKIGETALGNEIKMEILSQEKKEASEKKDLILIVGGVHPQENTGWFTGNGSNPGWLFLVKKWLEENKEEWKGLEIAMVDINPDGWGRSNANGVDLNRNFACQEACKWHKTNPNTRGDDDPDGPFPMSEPESQALINAAESLKKNNEILFMVSLHNVVPPKGLVDPGHCGKDRRSCKIAQEIAKLSGARYEEIWPSGNPNYPEGLGGQPIDYFSIDMGIPAADYEFSQREPNIKEANMMARTLITAVKNVYNLNP